MEFLCSHLSRPLTDLFIARKRQWWVFDDDADGSAGDDDQHGRDGEQVAHAAASDHELPRHIGLRNRSWKSSHLDDFGHRGRSCSWA